MDLADPGLRHIGRLIVPAIIGLSATQINIFIKIPAVKSVVKNYGVCFPCKFFNFPRSFAGKHNAGQVSFHHTNLIAGLTSDKGRSDCNILL